MGLFKKNIFGQYLFLKKWIIRILGTLSHRRYRGFNELQIEGSDILRNLPDTNVLFISNHQTYFADVVAMFHVFNAALSGRDDNIINVGYLWNPTNNNKRKWWVGVFSLGSVVRRTEPHMRYLFVAYVVLVFLLSFV